MQDQSLALEENEHGQMRSSLLIHKPYVVGPELCHIKKWVSLKKMGFQISVMSGICVQFALDQGTSHRNTWSISASL